MHAVRALSAPYNTPLSNPAPRPSCPSGGGSRRQTSSSRAPECLKRKLLHHQRRPCDQVQRDTVRDHRRQNQIQQVCASLGAGAVLALESRRHTSISTVRARNPKHTTQNPYPLQYCCPKQTTQPYARPHLQSEGVGLCNNPKQNSLTQNSLCLEFIFHFFHFQFSNTRV